MSCHIFVSLYILINILNLGESEHTPVLVSLYFLYPLYPPVSLYPYICMSCHIFVSLYILIHILNLGESEHTPVLVSVEKTYCTVCKYGFNYSEVYICIVSQFIFLLYFFISFGFILFVTLILYFRP